MKCPAQFKYKYIDRIKKKDESIEAFMGKLVHKTLEYLHNQRLAESMVSYDNLITYYSSMWEKHWHNRVAIVNKQILPIDRENNIFIKGFLTHRKNNFKKVSCYIIKTNISIIILFR